MQEPSVIIKQNKYAKQVINVQLLSDIKDVLIIKSNICLATKT